MRRERTSLPHSGIETERFGLSDSQLPGIRMFGIHDQVGLRNDLDRFHLVNDVIDRVPGLATHAAYTKQALRDKLIEHRQYITLHGEDMPEVRDWTWPY